MTAERILRQLRHFDWATVADLAYSLGRTSANNKQSIHRALQIGMARGLVVRDGKPKTVARYALTDAGRAAFAGAA